jgi:hypothetical protein
MADHVEMAVGDGIERSGKKRCARHGGGLARARMNRNGVKLAARPKASRRQSKTA